MSHAVDHDGGSQHNQQPANQHRERDGLYIAYIAGKVRPERMVQRLQADGQTIITLFQQGFRPATQADENQAHQASKESYKLKTVLIEKLLHISTPFAV